jgi:replicative DNA helicase
MSLAPTLDLRPANDPLEHRGRAGAAGLRPLRQRRLSSASTTPAAEHFFEPAHQRLFEAIESRIRKGQMADPIILSEIFGADPAFSELGGVRYLADLVDRAPPAANAAGLRPAIHDLAPCAG